MNKKINQTAATSKLKYLQKKNNMRQSHLTRNEEGQGKGGERERETERNIKKYKGRYRDSRRGRERGRKIERFRRKERLALTWNMQTCEVREL